MKGAKSRHFAVLFTGRAHDLPLLRQTMPGSAGIYRPSDRPNAPLAPTARTVRSFWACRNDPDLITQIPAHIGESTSPTFPQWPQDLVG